MDIHDRPLEEVFTEERTKALGFSSRVRIEFLQSMRWDRFEPIRTIGQLRTTSSFLLRRRPRIGDVSMRYVKAVLQSVGIAYP